MQDVVKKEALQLMGVLSFIFVSVLLSSFIGLKLFFILTNNSTGSFVFLERM